MCAHNSYLYYGTVDKYIPQLPNFLCEKKYLPRQHLSFLVFLTFSVVYRNIFQGREITKEETKYCDHILLIDYMSLYGKLYYIPKIMGVYRIVDNSCCRSYKETEWSIMALAALDQMIIAAPKYKKYFYYNIYHHPSFLQYRNFIDPDLRSRLEKESLEKGYVNLQMFLKYAKSGFLYKFMYLLRYYSLRLSTIGAYCCYRAERMIEMSTHRYLKFFYD